MSLIIVGSVRSAGATTVALTLAGLLEDAVLVEADPDGGVLALRYGLSREPGLASLAASRQPPVEALAESAQVLPGGLPVVVSPESPGAATHLLQTVGSRLAEILAVASAAEGPDVVVDAGRLSPSSPALGIADVAGATLVVARPEAVELLAAAERAAALGDRARLVLRGSGPYSPRDVASQLRCPVLATVVDDKRGALLLAQGGRAKALSRSPLVRSTRALAVALSMWQGGSPDPRSEASMATGVGR